MIGYSKKNSQSSDLQRMRESYISAAGYEMQKFNKT